MNAYLVATIKPWNLEAYSRWAGRLPGCWMLVTDPAHLEPAVRVLQPRYVFFPHWSWKVPDNILKNTECVCFHMTDLPYGRGGSPLQNLITHGHKETRLSALRMMDTLDTGPIYRKVPLPLTGRAEEIYAKAAEETFRLIDWIVKNQPEPDPQIGETIVFPRRKPGQSRLPLDSAQTINSLYDHIRMLDAPTYPHAFLDTNHWHIEFTHAEKDAEELRGRFRIRPKVKLHEQE